MRLSESFFESERGFGVVGLLPVMDGAFKFRESGIESEEGEAVVRED
jgi:hypothetical protein